MCKISVCTVGIQKFAFFDFSKNLNSKFLPEIPSLLPYPHILYYIILLSIPHNSHF